MGMYAEYLNMKINQNGINTERKRILRRIQELRGGRDILTMASAMMKPEIPISIVYNDRLAIQDQLDNLHGDELDIILETPGGSAEIVEDIVNQIRRQFSHVAVIIPGYAKSAGTIFAMAADEILMEPTSALGPIDAQIIQAGKLYSAHAFLEGLKKIKKEVDKEERLNRAYIPILQNISPGEIQSCRNALEFAKVLVQ